MIRYPIEFASHGEAASDLQQSWPIRSGDFELACSVPPEFEGPGGGLSPEDLYAQALTNCFIATFKVYAHHSKLVFEKVTADGQLVVDVDERKKPVMKRFHLVVKVTGASAVDRVRTIAQKAFSSGFILNSVKTELSLDLQVSD